MTTKRCVLALVALLAGCGDGTEAPAAEPGPPVDASDAAPASAPAAITALRESTPMIKVKDAAGSLPADVRIEGEVVAARRWSDVMGDNLLVLTLTGVTDHPCTPETSCGRDQSMYGYHYLVGGSAAPTLVWRTTDFIRDCDLDMDFAIRPEAVSVTDLDRDGTAETTYMYMMACRGDVSPGALKLIMHEGATKYAIRGWAELTAGPMHTASEMTPDPALQNGPPAFHGYAVGHWRRHQDMDLWTGQEKP